MLRDRVVGSGALRSDQKMGAESPPFFNACEENGHGLMCTRQAWVPPRSVPHCLPPLLFSKIGMLIGVT